MKKIRFLYPVTLYGLALLLPLLSAHALAIKQVYHEYKEGENFRRISEYFSGKENSGRFFVTRSQPHEYGGYYFVLRLDKPVRTLPPDSQVEVAVIVPGRPEPQVYPLMIPQKKSRSREIYAGISGSDWDDPLRLPLAWRVVVRDPEGTLLAERTSFLWNDGSL